MMPKEYVKSMTTPQGGYPARYHQMKYVEGTHQVERELRWTETGWSESSLQQREYFKHTATFRIQFKPRAHWRTYRDCHFWWEWGEWLDE